MLREVGGVGDVGEQLGQVVVEAGVELDALAAVSLRSVAAASSTRWRCSLATCGASASRISAPTSSSTARSALSTAALASVWWRQVAKRSVQPSTTSSWGPTCVGTSSPSKRSLPTAVSGAEHHFPSGPRQRTRAGDLVVAVAEDVGAHGHVLADRALGGVTGGRSGTDVADLDATHCWGDGRHGLGAYHPGPRGTPRAYRDDVDVRIVGTDLPGLRGPTTRGYAVGVQRKRDVEQLVAGDADGRDRGT